MSKCKSVSAARMERHQSEVWILVNLARLLAEAIGEQPLKDDAPGLSAVAFDLASRLERLHSALDIEAPA